MRPSVLEPSFSSPPHRPSTWTSRKMIWRCNRLSTVLRRARMYRRAMAGSRRVRARLRTRLIKNLQGLSDVSLITRNEGVRGSSPRVGSSSQENPCKTAIYVVSLGAEYTSPRMKGSAGRVRANPCTPDDSFFNVLRHQLPPSDTKGAAAGSERVQPSVSASHTA